MYEVELKVRANHDVLRERLANIGVEQLDTVEQTDVYFDAPDRDFARTDEALRIRQEQSETGSSMASLTYKGPLIDPDSKTREELETELADAGEMRSILEGLGYEPAATVEKRRERYATHGLGVTLDHVEELGSFVEVETTVENDVDSARDRAASLLADLGLDPADQIRTSYLGLLLENE